MISRFRATRKASSLLPCARGTPSDAKRIDSKVERVIAHQIDRFWLKKEKPSMRALIDRAREACLLEGLRLPHRSTIGRRIDELDSPPREGAETKPWKPPPLLVSAAFRRNGRMRFGKSIIQSWI
jgi:Mu DNA binding, I gamma subdomain